jgi:hypothetical protein
MSGAEPPGTEGEASPLVMASISHPGDLGSRDPVDAGCSRLLSYRDHPWRELIKAEPECQRDAGRAADQGAENEKGFRHTRRAHWHLRGLRSLRLPSRMLKIAATTGMLNALAYVRRSRTRRSPQMSVYTAWEGGCVPLHRVKRIRQQPPGYLAAVRRAAGARVWRGARQASSRAQCFRSTGQSRWFANANASGSTRSTSRFNLK